VKLTAHVTARRAWRALLASTLAAPLVVGGLPAGAAAAPGGQRPEQNPTWEFGGTFEFHCLDTNGDGEVVWPGMFDEDDEDAPDVDDATYSVDVSASGVSRLRPTRGGEFFVVHDKYRFDEVWTDLETGRWITVSGNGVFKELRPRQVDGTVYSFSFIDAGAVFTVRDDDGQVVYRDRGVVKGEALFDTLGDGQPGGEILWEDVSFAGQFPSWGLSICDIALTETRS
jgi:hypothetical protein